MSAVTLVWPLDTLDDDDGSALGGERLERVALDVDGLGDLLDGFGFHEQYAGVRTIELPDAASAPSLHPAQRVARRHVAFERRPSGLEIVAFVHRVPGLTREEFQVRYRALGLRLRVMEGPAQLLSRYAQHHVLGDEDGPDGISELGFADADALRAFITDPWLVDVLLPYEAEFLHHARTHQLLVRRQRVPVPAA